MPPVAKSVPTPAAVPPAGAGAAPAAGATPSPSPAAGAPAPAPAGKDPKAEPASGGAPAANGAAGTPAAGVSAPVVDPAAPVDPNAPAAIKPEEAALQAVTRREAKLVEDRRAIKAEREKFEAEHAAKAKEIADREAKLAPLLSLKESWADSPEKVVEQLCELIGTDARSLVKALAKGPRPETDRKLEAMQKELDARKKADEERAKKEADERAAQTKTKAQQDLVTAKTKISEHLASKPDDYELVLSLEEYDPGTGAVIRGPDLVYGMMQAHYDQTKQAIADATAEGADASVLQEMKKSAILPYDVAAAHAEKFLETRHAETISRLGRTKKFSKLAGSTEAPSDAPAAAGADPASGKTRPAPGIGQPTLAGTPGVSTPPKTAPTTDAPARRKTRAEIEKETAVAREKAIAAAKADIARRRA